MANNLHISYDLYSPNQDYSSVFEKIKQLGVAVKIHKSFWFVKSEYTAKQAAETIWSVMDADDTLYVVDSSNNQAYWFNLPDIGPKIQEQWNR